MIERRSVNIQGIPAGGMAMNRLGPIDITPEFRTVKEATDIDRERGNPAEQHHCPLCNEYFGWEAFKSHASQCINARAPRTRVWVPPGFSPNAIQSYNEKVKAD